MPPRDSADTFDTRMALRDNRCLDLRRPVPPLAFAREYLEPLRALAHRIITWDYHRSSASAQIRPRKLNAGHQPRKVGAAQRLPRPRPA